MAPALPEVGRTVGTAAVALVSLPLATALAAAAAREGQWDARALAGAALAGVVLLLAGWAGDQTAVAGLGRALVATAAGVAAARLLEEPWNVALVAMVVIGVDVYSVFAGPTRVIVDERPGLLSALTVPLAAPGDASAALIGLTDFVFFGLFCAACLRWRLRPSLTIALCAASFSATIVASSALDRALPALPLLSLAFVLPNLRTLATRRGAPTTSGRG